MERGNRTHKIFFLPMVMVMVVKQKRPILNQKNSVTKQKHQIN